MKQPTAKAKKAIDALQIFVGGQRRVQSKTNCRSSRLKLG